MTRILHHLRKDITAQRALVFTVLAILALSVISVIASRAVDPHTLNPLSMLSSIAPLSTISIGLGCLAAIVLADPGSGPRSFWMTRPLAGREVFATKLLIIGIACLALLVAELIVIAALLGKASLAPHLAQFAYRTIPIVAVGFALATVAPNTRGLMLTVLISGLVLFVLGSGFEPIPTPKRTYTLDASGKIAASLFVTIGGLFIAYHQYTTRHTKRSITLLGTLALVFFITLNFWPIDFLERKQATPSAPITLAVNAERAYLSSNIRHDNDDLPRRQFQLNAPIEIETGTPPAGQHLHILAQTNASTTNSEGNSLTTEDRYYSPISYNAALVKAALGPDIKLLTEDTSKNVARTLLLTNEPTTQWFNNQPLAYEGTLRAQLAHNEIAVEIPLVAGEEFHIDGASYTLLSADLVHDNSGDKEIAVEFNVVSSEGLCHKLARPNLKGADLDQHSPTLVNRQRGEAFGQSHGGASSRTDMGWVISHGATTTVFAPEKELAPNGIPANWLEGASLVLFHRIVDAELEQPLKATLSPKVGD